MYGPSLVTHVILGGEASFKCNWILWEAVQLFDTLTTGLSVSEGKYINRVCQHTQSNPQANVLEL